MPLRILLLSPFGSAWKSMQSLLILAMGNSTLTPLFLALECRQHLNQTYSNTPNLDQYFESTFKSIGILRI